MKRIREVVSVMVIVGLIFFSKACSKDDDSVSGNMTIPPSTSANKILPLGASRVAGARPEYESYRYELWKLLVDSGYEFDFIGTETDNASYPDFNGLSFDRDHEGRGGITSSGILAELDIWLTDLGTVPDIVLFSSPGGNDGIDQYQQSLSNINAIIDLLQQRNPNVTIYLELPAPPMSSEQSPEFLAFYQQALLDIALIAEQQTNTASNVLTVDMATGFTDNFLADDVHYNTQGAVFIAQQYFEALQTLFQ